MKVSIIDRFKKLNWEVLNKILVVQIISLYVLVFYLVPQGGSDLYVHYLPFASGELKAGFVPYFAQWFLYPLSLIPFRYVWVVWTLISSIGFVIIGRKTGINLVLFLLSFPIIGELFLGQIDLLIIIGLYLVIYHNSSFWKGLGIVLLLIKPQISGLVILYILLGESWKSRIKIMIIPIIVFGLSIVFYGPLWPIDWIQNAAANLPAHPWRISSKYLWIGGLMLSWLPLLIKTKKTKVELSLLLATLASPYFSIYSFSIFLILRTKWWTFLLSYLWVLFIPIFQSSALKISFILPVSLVIHLLIENKHEIKSTLLDSGLLKKLKKI